MIHPVFILLSVFITCTLSIDVIDPAELAADLLNAINKQFRENHYRIPKSKYQFDEGLLELAPGLITTFNIINVEDMKLFPEQRQFEFDFSNNHTEATQPFIITHGEQQLHGTVHIEFTKVVVKVRYLLSEPTEGTCVMKAINVVNDYSKDSVTSKYTMEEYDTMSENMKTAVKSVMEKDVLSSFVEAVQTELSAAVEHAANAAILDMLRTAAAGEYGATSCKTFVSDDPPGGTLTRFVPKHLINPPCIGYDHNGNCVPSVTIVSHTPAPPVVDPWVVINVMEILSPFGK